MVRLAGLALVFLVVLAGCAQVPSGDLTETPGVDHSTTAEPVETETPVETATPEPDEATPRPDPDEDVLGWENGYWYDDAIDVDPSDGLNETEMETVVARAMARVERVRGLEFEETVPVEIVSREEFADEEFYEATSEDEVVFDNVKFQALFMINESTDSYDVQEENAGASVGGYYDPDADEIVVVSENRTAAEMDELTLAHELVHALQDQYYNISSFDRGTRDRYNARNGIIEGDANYVEYLYERRCEDEWDGECLFPQTEPGESGDSELANYGPYLMNFQPYSDGPAFVRDHHEEGGWEAVNDVYETPPASSEQIIHPETYPDETPRNLTVEDRTSDRWDLLQLDGRPDYAEIGEAGLFSMFMYPTYETDGMVQLVPARSFFNYDESGDLDPIDPLNYEHDYTEGWDGDRMVVYTSDGGETAYVWKLAWDSEADAEEFLEGYHEMLSYRNASEVDDHEDTWVIDEGDDFAGAYYVHGDGDVVEIVHAPSVDELPEVHEGAAPPE